MESKPGERARLSPVYACNFDSWLTKFGNDDKRVSEP